MGATLWYTTVPVRVGFRPSCATQKPAASVANGGTSTGTGSASGRWSFMRWMTSANARSPYP
jgi:hypothetical protein